MPAFSASRDHSLRGEFSSPRLRYLPLARPHMPLYVGLYTNAEVMRHIGTPLTEERAKRAFRAALAQPLPGSPLAIYWAIGPRDLASVIGLNALVFDRGMASAEIGTLLTPQEQGKGFAYEAVEALLDRAFLRSPVECIHTRHAVGHPVVPKVLAKAGFVLEGTREGMRHWRLPRSAWCGSRVLQPVKL